MPSQGTKALVGLTNIEAHLVGLVKELQTQKKPSLARAALEKASNEVGAGLQSLPTSEPGFTPVRKSLTVVLNTLSGLHNGLSDGMSRKDFMSALANLNTRFIPKFRETVDALSKKLDVQSSRLDEKGLMQSESAIYDELVKVSNDLKRLIRILDTADKRNESGAGSQINTATRTRLDLVSATYGMLPTGERVDEAADVLIQIAGSLATISEFAKNNDKVSKKGLKNLEDRTKLLDKATANFRRAAVNHLITLGNDVRPSIASQLKRRLEGVDKPEGVKAELVRSPDQHLRERITEIKSTKADLPKNMKGPYTLLRAPVVAIFDSHDSNKRDRPIGSGTVSHNFTKSALLEQYGIKYVMVEDYLILQDQMLLAVDRKSVEQAVKAMNSRRRKGAKADEFVDYAHGVIDILNERGSQKYDLVTKEYNANPRNANMLLFWVMPSRVLDALISRGWNKLSTWNLPFDN